MAFDSAAKRFAIMDMEQVSADALPAPDGSFSQADRQHMLWGYIDPLWVAAPTTTGAVCITFGTGVQATISFGTGTQATITFADGTQATITFGEGSCP